jgi:hypothetical protein
MLFRIICLGFARAIPAIVETNSSSLNLKLTGIDTIRLSEPSLFCTQFGATQLANGNQIRNAQFCSSTIQG